jgi:hypothetical protein
LAANGNLEAAAEAEILCARAHNDRVRADDADAASERALALVADLRRRRRRPKRSSVGGAPAPPCPVPRGDRTSARGLALAEELGLVAVQSRAHGTVARILADLGEGASAEHEYERAIELGRDGVAPYQAQVALHNFAVEMNAPCRFRDAARLLDEAAAEAERYGIVTGVHLLVGQQAAGLSSLLQRISRPRRRTRASVPRSGLRRKVATPTRRSTPNAPRRSTAR